MTGRGCRLFNDEREQRDNENNGTTPWWRTCIPWGHGPPGRLLLLLLRMHMELHETHGESSRQASQPDSTREHGVSTADRHVTTCSMGLAVRKKPGIAWGGALCTKIGTGDESLLNSDWGAEPGGGYMAHPKPSAMVTWGWTHHDGAVTMGTPPRNTVRATCTVRRLLDDALTKRDDAFAAQSSVPAGNPHCIRRQATTGTASRVSQPSWD